MERAAVISSKVKLSNRVACLNLRFQVTPSTAKCFVKLSKIYVCFCRWKKSNVSPVGKDKREGSLISIKTDKVKLGETVVKTPFINNVYHEFPCYRSVSGIRHTSSKAHFNYLVVKLGDTKEMQKEKSFMLKNLDFLA